MQSAQTTATAAPYLDPRHRPRGGWRGISAIAILGIGVGHLERSLGAGVGEEAAQDEDGKLHASFFSK